MKRDKIDNNDNNIDDKNHNKVCKYEYERYIY